MDGIWIHWNCYNRYITSIKFVDYLITSYFDNGGHPSFDTNDYCFIMILDARYQKAAFLSLTRCASVGSYWGHAVQQ